MKKEATGKMNSFQRYVRDKMEDYKYGDVRVEIHTNPSSKEDNYELETRIYLDEELDKTHISDYHVDFLQAWIFYCRDNEIRCDLK